MSSRTQVFARVSASFALLLFPALMGARGCDPTPPPSTCTAIWDPVCGIDGHTYGNACEAEVAGVHIAYDGACEATCACPEIYAPVCGTDGVTYENDCSASCAGAGVVHVGACECAPVLCDLYCENGFERDPMTGCETCRCAPVEPSCVVDSDCGIGTFCDLSRCWAAMEGDDRDPTIPPFCVGACRPVLPPPPEWCTSDAECGPGARCDLVECTDVCDDGGACFSECHGVCVGEPPPSDLCTSDADCALGERCNTDDCLSLCEDAPDGTTCPAVCAGLCEPAIEPPPPPPSCASDADCATAEHCELYWCMGPPCAEDDPACILPGCGGSCVPDVVEPPPPLPPCRIDSDCGSDEYCALPRCIREEGCPTVGVCLPFSDADPA